ncbi:MAG: C40 family peptidase [Bacteroidota bacterium]|nr:C40 family peptidase [Bacteroidota bacterium]
MKASTRYILQALLLFAGTFHAWGQTPKIKDTLVQLYLLNPPADTNIMPVQTEIKKKPVTDSLFTYALSFMGNRYKRGGTSNKGFDCSGYTLTVFKHFGVKLPHTSAGQCLVGIEIKQKHIKKGDLLFFKGRNSRRKGIGHVGIVISGPGEPIRFIHSSSSAGVRIDYLEADYYKRRYLKATRVLPL